MEAVLEAPTKTSYPFEYFVKEVYSVAELVSLATKEYQRMTELEHRVPTVADMAYCLDGAFHDNLFGRAVHRNDVFWGDTNIKNEIESAEQEGRLEEFKEWAEIVVAESNSATPDSEFGFMFFRDVDALLRMAHLHFIDSFMFEEWEGDIPPLVNSPYVEVW